MNRTRNGEAIPLRINRRSRTQGVNCHPCREQRKRAFAGGWEGEVESKSRLVQRRVSGALKEGKVTETQVSRVLR